MDAMLEKLALLDKLLLLDKTMLVHNISPMSKGCGPEDKNNRPRLSGYHA